MTDSQSYIDRKSYFDNLITIYGRKPVLEVFQATDIQPKRLHLADSNQISGILKEILALANRKTQKSTTTVKKRSHEYLKMENKIRELPWISRYRDIRH